MDNNDIVGDDECEDEDDANENELGAPLVVLVPMPDVELDSEDELNWLELFVPSNVGLLLPALEP